MLPSRCKLAKSPSRPRPLIVDASAAEPSLSVTSLNCFRFPALCPEDEESVHPLPHIRLRRRYFLLQGISIWAQHLDAR